ncbi:type II secretion system inner membrane protein GspF [Desulfopila sp. IMCC35008]|uniref:type II secretion system inner membrane protein GspF n=1 Tax=Desulfopila sp. IMCC35008 TaxID=2653858 RepID=UPI0013D39907|nr:type II secretion system inner membrane protein GspF [Desulfopila sp. IMCC35008]
MPLYEYNALDSNGKKLKGVVDADNETHARSKLRSDGKYPVSIKEGAGKLRNPARSKTRISFFERIKQDDIHVMTRQLATLLGAAIPLVQALSSLVDQTDNPALKRVIARIRESVNEGSTLTSALGEHPKLFSAIYVNMIRAGEASGSLDVVLERLADFGENQQALRGKLKAALVYPIIMMVIGSAVLFILVTYVVPNITQVFDDMGRVLPAPTRFLLAASDILQNYWWLLLLLAVGGIMVFKFIISRPAGRAVWDLWKLKMFIFGPVLRKILLARFASTLASLLESGVGLIVSMQIVKTLIDNVRIADVLDEAMADIEKGKTMAHALSQSPWFPPMFVQMISIGEQSGSLEPMLEKISSAYEREVENAIMGMTSLIEPLMIVMMGGIVMFIVLSILLPIFEMNQLVG